MSVVCKTTINVEMKDEIAVIIIVSSRKKK